MEKIAFAYKTNDAAIFLLILEMFRDVQHHNGTRDRITLAARYFA